MRPSTFLPLFWCAAVALFLPETACTQTAPPELPAAAWELEPAHSALEDPDDYDSRLRQALFVHTPHDTLLRFLCKPSFEPETLAAIHRTDGGYVAILVQPEQQVWAHRTDPDPVNCTLTQKAIAAPIVLRLRDLWAAMLRRVRYPHPPCKVLDGVAYGFTYCERGQLWVGESWNPPEGSRPDLLALVGHRLVDYVAAEPAAEAEVLVRLETAAQELEARIAAVETGETSETAFWLRVALGCGAIAVLAVFVATRLCLRRRAMSVDPRV
jgi:hypothetical protein